MSVSCFGRFKLLWITNACPDLHNNKKILLIYFNTIFIINRGIIINSFFKNLSFFSHEFMIPIRYQGHCLQSEDLLAGSPHLKQLNQDPLVYLTWFFFSFGITLHDYSIHYFLFNTHLHFQSLVRYMNFVYLHKQTL